MMKFLLPRPSWYLKWSQGNVKTRNAAGSPVRLFRLFRVFFQHQSGCRVFFEHQSGCRVFFEHQSGCRVFFEHLPGCRVFKNTGCISNIIIQRFPERHVYPSLCNVTQWEEVGFPPRLPWIGHGGIPPPPLLLVALVVLKLSNELQIIVHFVSWCTRAKPSTTYSGVC